MDWPWLTLLLTLRAVALTIELVKAGKYVISIIVIFLHPFSISITVVRPKNAKDKNFTLKMIKKKKVEKKN